MSDPLLQRASEELEKLKAADAADLLLSPFIATEFLLGASAEAGPTNWVVNRSDIYDASLEALLKHPAEAVSIRAAEKLKMRKATITTLTPPEICESLEGIPDYSVEDYLGHPLCPFEAMMFFSYSKKEDHRASAALSLTRRVLEHPPNWNLNPSAKLELSERFGELLLSDPSTFVRSYAARIPILRREHIREAANKEEHPFVLGRILQNTERQVEDLESVMGDDIRKAPFVSRVMAFDKELPASLRRQLCKELEDPLSLVTHEWYLKRSA